MKSYLIESRKEVTQEQIDDIMADALHTAISYWCGEVRYRKHFEPKEEVKYMSDALTRGAVIQLWDFEEEKWLNLDLHRLIEAFGKIQFPFDDYDNNNVDELIQTAVFGEVIYG